MSWQTPCAVTALPSFPIILAPARTFPYCITQISASPWLYPALEVVHIFGIALLLGNVVLLEMRVFGLAPALPGMASFPNLPGKPRPSRR